MKSNDTILRKTKMSPKDPHSTLLHKVSSALTKARKARKQAFLTYESESDESVVPNVQVTQDIGDTPM